jgi:hypothetical protein
MEIKNILSELEIWIKNERKAIESDEGKLSLRKKDFDMVTQLLQNLLKGDNGTD